MLETLFQKWAAAQTPPKPLPPIIASQENPYLQALKLAEITEATFYQRQARRVRTWFYYHPDCKQLLLPLDWRDVQVRGETLIDVDARFDADWFERVGDIERPEHRLAEIEEYGDALSMAAAMNNAAYQSEILTAYPLPTMKIRKPRSSVSDKQLSLNLAI